MMDSHESQLKVRRGQQVFGPMTIIEVAELLAAGRVSESDMVSADGGKWLPIADYIALQGDETPESSAADSDDSFEIDLGGGAAPQIPAAPSPPAAPPAPATPPPPSPVPTTGSTPETYDLPSFLTDDDDSPAASPPPPPSGSGHTPASLRPAAYADPHQGFAEDVSGAPVRKSPAGAFDMDDDDDDGLSDDVLRALADDQDHAPALNRSSGGKRSKATEDSPAVRPPDVSRPDRRQFLTLFNGEDFSGWRFGTSSALPSRMPDNWKVEKGSIQLRGGGKPHLASQWEYEDFELRFAWRALEKASRGAVFLRNQWQIGQQGISLAAADVGGWTGGTLAEAKAVKKLQKPPGQWNVWRVMVVGDRVGLWCNGKPAWQAEGLQVESGYLGFQAAGTPMEFREIHLREIGSEILSRPEAWAAGRGDWTIKGGVLAGKPKVPLTSAKADYENFALRLEWKAGKGANGAVALRGPSFEMGKLELGGKNCVSGSLPQMEIAASGTRDNPPGQWNYLEVRVLQGAVSVWMNGAEIVPRTTMKGGAPASGPIALLQSSPAFRFRNIRIRPLEVEESGMSRLLKFGRGRK